DRDGAVHRRGSRGRRSGLVRAARDGRNPRRRDAGRPRRGVPQRAGPVLGGVRTTFGQVTREDRDMVKRIRTALTMACALAACVGSDILGTGSAICLIVESRSGVGPEANVFPTLATSLTANNTAIVLRGNFTAINTGSLRAVSTLLGSCLAVALSGDCRSAGL